MHCWTLRMFFSVVGPLPQLEGWYVLWGKVQRVLALLLVWATTRVFFFSRGDSRSFHSWSSFSASLSKSTPNAWAIARWSLRANPAERRRHWRSTVFARRSAAFTPGKALQEMSSLAPYIKGSFKSQNLLCGNLKVSKLWKINSKSNQFKTERSPAPVDSRLWKGSWPHPSRQGLLDQSGTVGMNCSLKAAVLLTRLMWPCPPISQGKNSSTHGIKFFSSLQKMLYLLFFPVSYLVVLLVDQHRTSCTTGRTQPRCLKLIFCLWRTFVVVNS